MKKKKVEPKRKLHQRAWKIFSIYIRKKHADFAGYVACITCLAQHPWNSGLIHAGHWIHDKLDFDERNVHPQCRDCNYKFNKNTNTAYAVYMAKTYGHEVMEEIRKESRIKGNDYSRQELLEIIEKYKELNNDE